jgi:hypothetical protein
MSYLRTEETERSYEEHKANGHLKNGCVLCKESSLKEFTYWRLIDNKFPYDRVSTVHHMIIPKRHVIETELTESEKDELIALKHDQLNQDYVYIIEALPGMKSIPEHFHLHLIVTK